MTVSFLMDLFNEPGNGNFYAIIFSIERINLGLLRENGKDTSIDSPILNFVKLIFSRFFKTNYI